MRRSSDLACRLSPSRVPSRPEAESADLMDAGRMQLEMIGYEWETPEA